MWQSDNFARASATDYSMPSFLVSVSSFTFLTLSLALVTPHFVSLLLWPFFSFPLQAFLHASIQG